MNVLIIGSSGLLGREIYERLKKNVKINLYHNGLKKHKYNLLSTKNLLKLVTKSKPDLIINSSGCADIDICEKNKKSYLINVEMLKNIFKVKKKYQLKFNLIHFSSDQLYDSKVVKYNKERSRIIINNEYSNQKFKAEKICLKNKSLIFRVNFFGKTKSLHKSFTDWIIFNFKKRKKFYLFNDIYFNPLRIKTIAQIIEIIILRNNYKISGIYNLASKNYLSKSDFAIKFIKRVGFFKKNYELISCRKFLNVKRSKNMVMNNKKFTNKFKIDLPSIHQEIINESKNYK
jgi:dTDP-4-dehydrorhamnose reductase